MRPQGQYIWSGGRGRKRVLEGGAEEAAGMGEGGMGRDLLPGQAGPLHIRLNSWKFCDKMITLVSYH